MPKQDGHNPLRGTVDNLTYYRSKDGYKVRKRGMLEKGRVFTDPKFKRTRENMSEFSEAAKQNKLIRTAFSPLLKNIADKLVMRRLSTGLGLRISTCTCAQPLNQMSVDAYRTL